MVAFLLLTGSLAWAGQPECPSTPASIRSGAQQAMGLFDDFAFDAFQVRFDQLVDEIRCVTTPLSKDDALQIYQLQVVSTLVSKDETRMVAALCALLAVDPTYRLPEELAAPGSTLDAAYQQARAIQSDPTRPLKPQGTWYVDGVSGVTDLPESRAALIQHVSTEAELQTWLLDGRSMPWDLEPFVASPAQGGRATARSPVPRSRMLAMFGGATAVAALTSFAVSASAYQEFYAASDPEEAVRHQTLNHRATIAGSVLSVAAGGLVVGAVVRSDW